VPETTAGRNLENHKTVKKSQTAAYGKKAAKIGYFQITKQWFNVRSGKCTDELN
jgi:hypothetical protein